MTSTARSTRAFADVGADLPGVRTGESVTVALGDGADEALSAIAATGSSLPMSGCAAAAAGRTRERACSARSAGSIPRRISAAPIPGEDHVAGARGGEFAYPEGRGRHLFRRCGIRLIATRCARRCIVPSSAMSTRCAGRRHATARPALYADIQHWLPGTSAIKADREHGREPGGARAAARLSARPVHGDAAVAVIRAGQAALMKALEPHSPKDVLYRLAS